MIPGENQNPAPATGFQVAEMGMPRRPVDRYEASSLVAGAVFLILELDQPMTGLIRISSEPIINALNQLAK
jgi:hypothetical protein